MREKEAIKMYENPLSVVCYLLFVDQEIISLDRALSQFGHKPLLANHSRLNNLD